jgi:hypothetical protein
MAIEIGSIIGRLTVIAEAEPSTAGKKKMRRYVCRCECGTEKTYLASSLMRSRGSGNGSWSCGCLRREATRTHGKYGSPEYSAWENIKTRYPEKMHDEWRREFTAFYKDVGAKPSPNHKLICVDRSIGYAPGNVRWTQRHSQS